MRQRLDGYPRQFMPAEHVHVPRTATHDIMQERFRPVVEEPQVERVGIDMQTPRLVIQRSYLSVQIRHMASGIHRLALNQHRLACRVERGTRIEFAYRTAVQSCLGYMQVGVQQQGAEHAVQRCRTGDLTLCRQRLFRHRGETEYGTQIHILEPHHQRVVLMGGSYAVNKDMLLLVTHPQVLHLQCRIRHRISDTRGIDVPQRVSHHDLRRQDMCRYQRLMGILGERGQTAQLSAVTLLDIVAQVERDEHRVVHSHHIHQHVGIAYMHRIRQVDMCRGAQVDTVVAVVGGDDNVAYLLLPDAQHRHNAAQPYTMVGFVYHTLERQIAALRYTQRQHVQQAVEIMGVEVERRLRGGRTVLQPVAHRRVKQVRQVVYRQLLDGRTQLGVTEVTRYPAHHIIRLQLQAVVGRVVAERLGGDLQLCHSRRVACIGDEQTVEHQIAVDMIDMRAVEIDIQLPLYVAVVQFVGQVQGIQTQVLQVERHVDIRRCLTQIRQAVERQLDIRIKAHQRTLYTVRIVLAVQADVRVRILLVGQPLHLAAELAVDRVPLRHVTVHLHVQRHRAQILVAQQSA